MVRVTRWAAATGVRSPVGAARLAALALLLTRSAAASADRRPKPLMEVRRVFFARVERVDNFSRSIHVDDKTLVPLDDRQICGFDTIAETVNGNFRLRPLDRPTRKYL